MSDVYDIADRHVERYAALDPVAATAEGLTGHDDELTDYSPDAEAERASQARATLADLDHAAAASGAPPSDADRVAAEVLRERLSVSLDLHAAREHLRPLRVLGSPLQDVRMVFDLMPASTVDDWSVIAARMARVPAALASLEGCCAEGIRQGLTSAARQVIGCAEQARVWSGTDESASRPFFSTLLDRYDASGLDDAALRSSLAEHSARANDAYARLGRYLLDEYAPRADADDAVGPERYGLWARVFNGLDLDLEETYRWGWDELARIEDRMVEVAGRIVPGGAVTEAIELLETDPGRAIEGVDAFRGWLQDLLDRTVEELDGAHFDIPAPVRRVEAMIAPPGGAAAMYYTGPSEDFTRPGRTWYPTLGRTRFPLWGEVSICYHEGVPGHHLQIAQVRYLAGTLSRFQRTLAGTSGHAEGWALYAERLMGELGYLDVPDHELGMLRAQAMRAVRVVADIGMHLRLPVPAAERAALGDTWTPERALPWVTERSRFPADFMRSEVDRYLGMPGQAISYKVGERVWLEGREAARRAAGPAFDLAAFHARALALGPMGLAQLARELGAS